MSSRKSPTRSQMICQQYGSTENAKEMKAARMQMKRGEARAVLRLASDRVQTCAGYDACI